jgi:AraC-like DNA-binding protein
MLKRKMRIRGTVFWKTTGIVMLVTCIPLIIIGAILLYLGTDVIGTEVTKAHKSHLDQSIQQMDDYLSGLEKFVVRIAFDPSFDESLNRMDLAWEFEKTNDLIKSLSLMKESNSLISNVTLYLREADKLISDESGIRSIQTESDRKLFSSLLEKDQTIYLNYSLKQINKPDSSYTTVVVKLPGGRLNDSFGAFLIYLDQNKLNSMVQKLATGKGISFLINENNEDLTTLLSNEPNQQLQFKEALVKQINERHLDESTFKIDWEEQSYSVSYGSIAKLGGKWTVISATPDSQIAAPVTFISRLIIQISVVCLVIGLMMSWFASNKIYAPILRVKNIFESGKQEKDDEKDEIVYIENQWRRHLDEQEALKLRMKQSIPTLRDSFLLQFLQGNLYFHSELEIIDQLGRLEWDVRNKRFAFLVAQLHGINDLGSIYSARDSQLLTFAASNILLELCSQNVKMVHIINFQDLSVGAFFLSEENDNQEQLHHELNKQGSAFITTTNNVLRMKATVVISQITESIMETPKVLEQSRKALRFRDLDNSNQILDMSNFLINNHQHKMKYSFDLERRIVHAISSGLEDEAMILIRQFLTTLVEQSNGTELVVHQGMMKLLGTIQDLIIRYDMNLYDIYDGVHLYEQLMHIHEPDEMLHWFQHKLIQPFVKALSITYDANLRTKIEQLLSHLKVQYLSNISLDAYAEELEMSPSRLSKVFKQFTGENFIDYIVKLKLEHCKELLIHSDMKINEISDLLSYQPSYLIRIFKKNEKVTPGQYREKYTKSI